MPRARKTGRRRFKWLRQPRGHYVYGWYDGDHLFYVGHGTFDRALARHETWDGFRVQPSYCELRRAGCRFFRVRIFMDDMAEAEAAALEAALINIFGRSAIRTQGLEAIASSGLSQRPICIWL